MSKADFDINNISSCEPTLSDMHKSSRSISLNSTDYSCNHINPSPIKIPRNCGFLEEFLSPRKLQVLTGVDDLQNVEYLEMRVVSEQMSLGNFGTYLPNLSEIKLSGSCIKSIRDLGTSLWSVQVLWMPRCSLQCLDGLVTMSNLKELYLAYNEIDDISSCGMLENLEILDLEGNIIDDLANVQYLSVCPVLTHLTLEGNPLCNANNYIAPQTYRTKILEILTQLRFLDDQATDLESEDVETNSTEASTELRDTLSSELAFEDHWDFINSVLMESELLTEALVDKGPESRADHSSVDSGRPSSSYTISSRSNTSARPLSTQRLSSSAKQRSDCGDEVEERPQNTILTAGKVVCGSITKSLRRRCPGHMADTREGHTSEDRYPRDVVARQGSSVIHEGEGVDEACEMILRDLDEWRLGYARSKTRIEQQRVPQVLTIECSEDEIEEVTLQSTTITPQKPDKANNNPNHKPSLKPKEKSAIKLNPIRNGKVAPVKVSLWRGQDDRSSLECVPQQGRIRRHLLECRAPAMTPVAKK